MGELRLASKNQVTACLFTLAEKYVFYNYSIVKRKFYFENFEGEKKC